MAKGEKSKSVNKGKSPRKKNVDNGQNIPSMFQKQTARCQSKLMLGTDDNQGTKTEQHSDQTSEYFSTNHTKPLPKRASFSKLSLKTRKDSLEKAKDKSNVNRKDANLCQVSPETSPYRRSCDQSVNKRKLMDSVEQSSDHTALDKRSRLNTEFISHEEQVNCDDEIGQEISEQVSGSSTLPHSHETLFVNENNNCDNVEAHIEIIKQTSVDGSSEKQCKVSESETVHLSNDKNNISKATTLTKDLTDNLLKNVSAKDSNCVSFDSPKEEIVEQSSDQDILKKGSKAHPGTLTEKENNDEEEETNEYKIPYYLENFVFILQSVINDEFYGYLFNESDHSVITAFKQLSENTQKVYIRLFGRQFRWIRKNKIVYPKIAEDLTDSLEELVSAGLLQNESSLDDLSQVLQALPAPDLKTVAKSLRLNINSVRLDLITAVIKHTNQSNIGSFFKVKGGSKNKAGIHSSVLQRAKKLLGSCYRLCKVGRSVFMRVMLLFGLHNMQGEDDDKGRGQQLFQMLMSNIGRVKYPEYTVCRKTKIFQNREGLQRLSVALQSELEISEALDKKEYDAALEVYLSAKAKMTEILNDQIIMVHDKSLPLFLRTYTAGAVYTRVLSYGVELFQFTKKYNDAVDQLQALVEQDLYHTDYRGRWYERLTLNLDHHLKKPAEALDVIKRGLNDPNIRLGHRFAIFQRAQKICNANANKKLKKRWQEFSEDVMVCVHESPKVYIKGRQIKSVVPGGYNMFISEESLTRESEEVTFLKCVEDVALNHYKEAGYSEGLHAEGGIFAFLMTLYLWDIIFSDTVADVFYNLYQTMPLDLYTQQFYDHRKQLIDGRLKMIQNATEEELHNQLEEAWEKHKDTLCVGISWELFKDIDHAKGLVSCMGGSALSSIFCRMTSDRRFTRSGLPDLTIWNPETKKFKMVEVKGPGDRLSTKQILWIDYFLSIGVEAEVCHVQAVDAKKLH